MPGIEVRRRTSGDRLEPTTTVLRFYVADVNRVIANAAANATHYSDLVSDRPAGWEVLALSCFAITDQWTPERLAEGTSFAAYLEVSAQAVIEAGYELWPTDVFTDGEPDPRNGVHYDLIVAQGVGLLPAELLSADKAERKAARSALRPRFDELLALLGEPRQLPERPAEDGIT